MSNIYYTDSIEDEYTVRSFSDGAKRWYKNNVLHREGNYASISSLGTKDWCINGKLHREDGPATEWSDGDNWWYFNDQLHRLDGPAIDEAMRKEYWYHGTQVDANSTEEFIRKIKLLAFI